MIDGLKLTMTGTQLRAHLEDRIRWHQEEIRRLASVPVSLPLPRPGRTGERPPMTERHRDGAIVRAERQIQELGFIRDYVVAGETYLLGEFDLRFADLLADDDGWDCDCAIDPIGLPGVRRGDAAN